ncbi:Quinone oxidoreductase [Acinetobacter sp. 8I-beige]|uniref:quinone oxidoreductase family protein n=1 Tax=Acinetobacter sp. 8I-beige TaxID=2653125 RepID=UPI0012F022F5|nr:zinc-binding alcohol dehydrogenase family protein [Acinetobacter sp. 8I-beige]VXA86691.1 Quinone oxidoreductase [Acinetobacter sp. 8I-beige]
MQALVLLNTGSHPEMVIQDRPIPSITQGHSLIKVYAATINPLSNQIRSGIVPQAVLPLVLSNDGSGTVVDSEKFAKGTKVAIYGGADIGITKDGMQQEWVLIENERIIELPDNFSLEEGAALPINYVTAHQALVRVGQIEVGQKVLITGASGSLGSALIQVSKALGATPIAIVSNSSKVQRAKDAGAEHVIDLSCDDFHSTVLSLTDNQGADLACDAVGGELLGRLVKSLRTRGAVVSIGFVGGITAQIDLIDVVVYEKKILGYDAHLETQEDVNKTIAVLKQFIHENKVRPCIDSTYPLDQYLEAYKRLESRKAQGTILIRL